MADEKAQVKFNSHSELSLLQPFCAWALKAIWRCQEPWKVTHSFLYVGRVTLKQEDRWKSILYTISREDSKTSLSLHLTMCAVTKFFLISSLNPKCYSFSLLPLVLASAEMETNGWSPILARLYLYRFDVSYSNLAPFLLIFYFQD